MKINDIYEIYLKHPFVKIDTRKLQQGDIFFALKGPHFNGNYFAKVALDAGAAYVFSDEDTGIVDERIIRTDDSLLTLQALAKHHREQFTIPFIAITGSNGKTTTKELINAVLSSTLKTYTTEGNLNNHIGIPLTILKIKKDAEIAVIEMGANHQKEIEGYCRYAMPTHGLITNIGKAHLEGFGNIEGVIKGKGELFDYIKNINGSVFVNNMDQHIIEKSSGIKNIITYGKENADITGKINSSSPFLEVSANEIGLIKTQLVGEYNFLNVLASVAVGRYFKVDDTRIKSAIKNYRPSNSRSQLIQIGSNAVILDAYNANPGSMKAAIENFAKMEGNKILLLGSMMELGAESEKEHEEIIKLIKKYNWSQVALVGQGFKKMADPFINFDNVMELREWFKEQNFHNAQILIKGSRSMEMEKVLT